MSIFTNTGVNIDVNNVHVKQLLAGTPNIDKYYKEKFIPYVEKMYNDAWKDRRKQYFKEHMWKLVSAGLSENMFDAQGKLDPYVGEIINTKCRAYLDGWNDRCDMPNEK